MYEEFESIREFNKKFPSKMYICSRCNSLTYDPYQCHVCQNQSNNILLQDKVYNYTIQGKTSQIFMPIEIRKEKTIAESQEKVTKQNEKDHSTP